MRDAFDVVVENGAKKYHREFTPSSNYDGLPWNKLFTMEDRRAVARELNDDFMANAKHGEYDYLLPKKYAKRA